MKVPKVDNTPNNKAKSNIFNFENLELTSKSSIDLDSEESLKRKSANSTNP